MGQIERGGSGCGGGIHKGRRGGERAGVLNDGAGAGGGEGVGGGGGEGGGGGGRGGGGGEGEAF